MKKESDLSEQRDNLSRSVSRLTREKTELQKAGGTLTTQVTRMKVDNMRLSRGFMDASAENEFLESKLSETRTRLGKAVKGRVAMLKTKDSMIQC